jgi:cytochrome c biogenesis factor
VQSPLVAWIWVGAVILALGTGYALLPNPRRGQSAVREGVPA